MKFRHQISRRVFLKRSALAVGAAGGFPYIIPSSALGADGRVAPSERIAVGCIGVGPQGNGVMGGFLRHREAQVVAVCDVQRPRRESTKQRVDEHYKDTGCAMYNDFREIVARDDIDAFLIASCDHWHVLHGLAAARAGKDMYVEKPLGVWLAQDQALREAIHTHGRIFQFGTQQRSSREFQHACELVRNGYIGALHTIHVAAPASVASGYFASQPVPDWLDYEMWLGPAPWSPYSPERISNLYWWHNSDYAVGFVAGWGIHHVDIAQWGCGADDSGPVEIEGTGVFPTEGFCDCAIAWNIECKYANGVRMIFTDDVQKEHGVRFEGSEGWVYVRRGFIDAEPKSLLSCVMKPDEIHLTDSKDHVGNFLECIKTRRDTVCPIDTAVRSDTICYISDIAMRLHRPLRWDPEKERFIGDEEANRRLTRAMRSPWRL